MGGISFLLGDQQVEGRVGGVSVLAAGCVRITTESQGHLQYDRTYMKNHTERNSRPLLPLPVSHSLHPLKYH